MTHRSHPSIEPLESRVAPATISVGLVGGNLTLVADANDTQLSVNPGPNGTFQLFSAGNNFDFVDDALDTMTQTFVKVTGSVAVTFQNTSDSLSIQDVKIPKGLTVTTGSGTNFVTLTNVAIGGDLTINGGGDADGVTLSGTRVTVGGSAKLLLGEGTNSVGGGVNTLKVGKDFVYTGGAAMDTISALVVGSADIKGNASVDLGPDGVGTLSLNPVNLKVGGSLTVTGGSASDTLNLQPITARIGKDFTVNLGGERNNINVLTGDFLTVGGAVAFTQATNPTANKSFSILIANGKLTIGKGLSISHGDGFFDTTVRGSSTQIGGAVLVTQGDHNDATTNFLSLSGVNTFTVKGALTVDNGDGLHSVNIAGSNLLSIGSATKITHGNHAAGNLNISLESTFITDLKGGLEILGGTGDSTTQVRGTERLNIAGNLSVTNGSGTDTFILNGEKTAIKGGANIQPGSGASAVTINAPALLTIGGNFLYATSATNASLTLSVGGGSIAGDFGVNSPTTTSTLVSVIAKFSPLALKKRLAIDTESAAGTVTLQFVNVSVAGNTLITDTGASTAILIEDGLFAGTFTADLGTESDTINIEKNFTPGSKPTIFGGDVSILLGDTDNDVLSIGNSSSPALHGIFKKLATFDGGNGAGDTLTLSSAQFLVAGQPVSTGF